MRRIEYIIVHATATPEGREHDAADIDRWHRARGWSQIGYNYVVKLNGQVEFGSPVELIPAHAVGYNKNSIAVVYVGGTDLDGKPKDTRTPQQKEAMLQLLEALKEEYPTAMIIGHNDVSSKACPCFNAKQEYHKLNY